MRFSLALVLAAGLVTLAAAVQPPPATDPAAPPAVGNSQPAAATQPKGIPVPDGPVVNKQELEDGLIIEDITIGDGYEVKPGGAVVVHYHGTLKEGGKEFDSSFSRGEPISFPLGNVIPGWQKGVPGMKIGGVRRLTIPSKLGYGEQGAGASIPPNSDLVFTIQLVDAMQIEDTKVGEGEAASVNCVAVTAFSVKDGEGKEVEKADAAHPYIWLPGEFQAISFGLDGMKPGGKRTIRVPKEMNVTAPGAPATRPSNVPLTIEVELIAVRNLGPRGQ